MGPLLSDLARKMQAKAEKGDTDSTKILIHSTHDTCLAGLSSTLDIFDEKYVLSLDFHTLSRLTSYVVFLQMACVYCRGHVRTFQKASFSNSADSDLAEHLYGVRWRAGYVRTLYVYSHTMPL